MPGGRPTRYKKEYVELAYNYALLGGTNEQIAKFFGVSIETLRKWMHRHKEFVAALKRGKEQADAEVSQSLFHRAKGYSHPDVKIMQYEGKVIEVPIMKHHPPDVTACIFWLKNRQPAIWRDKQNIEHKHEFPGIQPMQWGTGAELKVLPENSN